MSYSLLKKIPLIIFIYKYRILVANLLVKDNDNG